MLGRSAHIAWSLSYETRFVVNHDARGNGSTLFVYSIAILRNRLITKFKMAMKLKHLIPFTLAAILLAGCNKQESEQWEYKVLPIIGSKLPTVYSPNDKETLIQRSDFQTLEFFGSNFDMMLDSYGKDGWELVNVYTTIETAFPNFGDAEYHTGVKENTRTQTINFVFKRRVNASK